MTDNEITSAINSNIQTLKHLVPFVCFISSPAAATVYSLIVHRGDTFAPKHFCHVV